MAGVQNFRSAIGGFNREDVVRYIEYINNKHNMEITQLNNQLENTREALEKAKAVDNTELREQLKAAELRCAELEARLSEMEKKEPVKTGEELEAYRRAERAERLARDRAAQIYEKANAALADATAKVEAISDSMASMADQITEQVTDAKNQLREATAAMYAIRPEEE